MPICQYKLSKGFTLIEVLVAMAILAVALAAANRASGLAINHSIALKHGILADIVAQNQLALHVANDDWKSGRFSGSTQQAGITFQWQEEITSTPNPAFMKLTITVQDPNQPKHHIRRLVGFLVNPQYQYGQ